jgi:NifU-like protein involved in Fe-S cluster formation
MSFDETIDDVIKDLNENLKNKNNLRSEKTRLAAAKNKIENQEDLIKIKFEQNENNRTRLLKRLRDIQEEEKEDFNYILEILY